MPSDKQIIEGFRRGDSYVIKRYFYEFFNYVSKFLLISHIKFFSLFINISNIVIIATDWSAFL